MCVTPMHILLGIREEVVEDRWIMAEVSCMMPCQQFLEM